MPRSPCQLSFLSIPTYITYVLCVCICLARICGYFSVVPPLRCTPLLLLLGIGLAVNRVRQSPHPLTKLMAGSVTNDHQSHCVGRGRGRARVWWCCCCCCCLMFQVSSGALECPLKAARPVNVLVPISVPRRCPRPKGASIAWRLSHDA